MRHTSLDGALADSACRASLFVSSGHGFDHALGHIRDQRAAASHAMRGSPGCAFMAGHSLAGSRHQRGRRQGRELRHDRRRARSADRGERSTAIAEFRRVRLDATGIAEWPQLVAALDRRLRAEREIRPPRRISSARAGNPPARARCPAHLRRDADLLKAEADQAAAASASLVESWTSPSPRRRAEAAWPMHCATRSSARSCCPKLDHLGGGAASRPAAEPARPARRRRGRPRSAARPIAIRN